MAHFMDVHEGMEGVSQAQLKEAHDADLKFQSAEGVSFQHAWADPSTGKVFCLSEAPNADAVRRVHEQAGHPTSEVYEVSVEV